MLALYLMAMFGLLAAVMSSFTYIGSKTATQVTQLRDEATRDFFSKAASLLIKDATMQQLQITGVSTCNGTSLQATDPRSLLCKDEILQLASWDMKGGVLDPWLNPVNGVVATETSGIGPGVMGPVTAFALVSAGPDRQIAPTLAANLTSLKAKSAAGTADVREVMRLEAVAGTDDIVMTFSNLTAQMHRWDYVENAIKRIADAAQGRYMQDFYAFAPQIRAYMQAQLAAGVNPVDLVNDPVINKGWKNLNDPAKPALFRPESPSTNQYLLGVDEEFALITKAIPEGSALRLATTVTTASPTFPTAKDVMTIQLTNNGSPWGDASGRINYSYQFKMNY